jgi:aryl sulfotransferase
MDYPKVTHTYLNHHLDSSRWEVYEPQAGDIVVTTSYKCGTTFTQQLLYNMLVRNTAGDETFPDLEPVSPWLDSRTSPMSKEELGGHIKTLPHQRFLKSHLPLDGLPYFKGVKYIIVGRDPRDVFMSLVNHYGAYTDFYYDQLKHEGEQGMPRFDGDIRGFWKNWITRGWFDWEQEGSPFWSNMHHTQTYWDYNYLPNFLFLHYADMLSDLPGTVKQLAEFIGLAMTSVEISAVVKAVSFGRVKQQALAESALSSKVPEVFKGGQATFINKGTNGRWRDVLTDEDLDLYKETRDKVLSPDCATWLEEGAASLSQ